MIAVARKFGRIGAPRAARRRSHQEGRGVSFEHYDLPGTTRDGDIHTMGGMRGVWLEDPDGNIIAVVDQ